MSDEVQRQVNLTPILSSLRYTGLQQRERNCCGPGVGQQVGKRKPSVDAKCSFILSFGRC